MGELRGVVARRRIGLVASRVLPVLLVLLVPLVFLAACTADEPEGGSEDRSFDERLADASDGTVWVQRDEGGRVQAATAEVAVPDEVPADPTSRARWFVDTWGSDFGVDDPEDVEPTGVVEGEAGTPEEGDAVVTFERTEDDVPVYGSEVKVEVRADGTIVTVVSQVPSEVDVDTTATVAQAEAEGIALAAHPGATVAGSELVILNEAMFRGEDGPSRLTWKVDLRESAVRRPTRFVDAHEGVLLGFATTRVVDARNRRTFTARQTCNPPMFEEVLDEDGAVMGRMATADATSGHAQARTIWDWFWSTFQRDSHDGRGADVLTHTDLRDVGGAGSCVAMQNAYWSFDDEAMFFGEGMVSLDVFAHEYTHGLVQGSADLVYQGQPGALNESFADVFAAFIDTGTQWTIGDGSAVGVIRDMTNPTAHSQPDHTDTEYVMPAAPVGPCRMDSDCGTPCWTGTMCASDECFVCAGSVCQAEPHPCNDYGGVHINSGIPNLAAHLITDGGTGPRDGIEVIGIGQDKAEQIYFRALTWYLTAGATFEYAKIALRLAAWKFAQKGMHGVTYNDCGSVLTGYGAVGIGSIDTDRDCFTDAVDNCPTVYNPMQETVDCIDCSDRTMCQGCALTDGCGWCKDTGSEGCVHLDRETGCMDLVEDDPLMCSDTCSDRGGPCSGSGTAFDDECCEGLICVVGGCTDAACGRERATCADSSECCAGLQCRRVGSASAPLTCCARDTDYCTEKADCCGLMDCVDNRCQGRSSGETCLLGDCTGTSFCDSGTCT